MSKFDTITATLKTALTSGLALAVALAVGLVPGEPPGWRPFVADQALRAGLSPAYVMAVAEVESSGQGQRFRFGPLGRTGRYLGPFGLHSAFLKKWPDLADPYRNTEVAVRALARYGPSATGRKKALRKYNASFTEAYWKRITWLERRNQHQLRK